MLALRAFNIAFTDFLLLRLHLHAIFHIVTTMSPYCYVVFMTYHRCLVLKREAEHRVGIGLAYVHVKEIAPWSARARRSWDEENIRFEQCQGCLENYWKNHFEKTNKPSKYPQKKYQFNTAVHVVRCCWSLAMPGDNASCIGRWRGEGWVIFSWGRGPLQFITDFIWFQKVYITRSIYIYTLDLYMIYSYIYIKQYMFVVRCKVIPWATGGGPLIWFWSQVYKAS